MTSNEADYVTVREMYASLGQIDTKTVAALKELKAEIVHQFELHEQTHQAEEARRTSRSRWLVGTALTIGGLTGGFAGHIIEKLLG